MKSKTGKQTFCKYYYNIFCHLFILFGGVCGCAGYFIIFARCMIINLHLNHRHRHRRRRPCLAQTIGPFGSVQLFFQPFFAGLLSCLRSTFWNNNSRLCVCGVCGYTHNIINHKVSHDFILTPSVACSPLALLHLQHAGFYFLALRFSALIRQ